MGIGTIIYYILWPLVMIALGIAIFFEHAGKFMKFSVDIAKDLHDDIKGL